MDKKELTLQVIERLKKEYPEAKCTLDYDKAWQLLVSVRLAAQCTMKVLHEKYNDNVPETFEELLALPGVGRKSANLIMGDVFGKPAIVTDTHCIRLCNLIGMVDGIKEPAKVERELWKIVPPEEGNDLCHRFVLHGRAVCVARRPRCAECCLKDICRYGKDDENHSL